MNRGNRILLSCIYWAFVLYVFAPLLLMILMGFKDSKFIGLPIKPWTLDWYTGVFADSKVVALSRTRVMEGRSGLRRANLAPLIGFSSR